MSLNKPTARSRKEREKPERDLTGIDQFDPQNVRALKRAKDTTLQVFNILHQRFPVSVYEEVDKPYLEAVCHWTGGEIDPSFFTDEVDPAELAHTPDMEGLIDARRRLHQLLLKQIPIELMPQDIEPEDIDSVLQGLQKPSCSIKITDRLLVDEETKLNETQSSDFQDLDEDIHPDQADQFLHLQQIKRRAKQPRGFPETPAACKRSKAAKLREKFRRKLIDGLGQVE